MFLTFALFFAFAYFYDEFLLKMTLIGRERNSAHNMLLSLCMCKLLSQKAAHYCVIVPLLCLGSVQKSSVTKLKEQTLKFQDKF